MLIATLFEICYSFVFTIRFLKVKSPIIVIMQNAIMPFITVIVKHKFCPDTIEIQSSIFSVSYFKLTIVFTIPKTKIGITEIMKVNMI